MSLSQVYNLEIFKTYSISTFFTDSLTAGMLMEMFNVISGNNGVFNPSLRDTADPVIRITTWIVFALIVVIRIGYQLSKWNTVRIQNKTAELENIRKEKNDCLDNQKKELELKIQEHEAFALMEDIKRIRILAETEGIEAVKKVTDDIIKGED